VESSKLLKAVTRDVARHERELAVIKEPHAREVARDEAAQFATAELAVIDQLSRNQCSHYMHRYREWFGTNPENNVPHPVGDHQRSALLGRWGAKLLMAFEVAFAAWLTATFNFAQHLWTAMAVTAGLWLAASAGLAQFVAILLKRRSEVPQETRNRIHTALRICLIGWLAGAALMLIMRTAQGKTALVLAHATTFVLAAWAIDTILLAGCGIGADRLFRWSGDAAREYYATTRLRSRVAQLLDRSSTENPARPSIATSSMAGRLAVAVLAIGLGFTAAAPAQTMGPTAALQAGCTYVDETTSVQPGAVQSVLDQHKVILPALAERTALKSWCFVPFTADAWTSTPSATVEVPPASKAACAQPSMGEADALFRGAREERLKKARQACAATKTRSNERFKQDLSATLADLGHNGSANGRCSSVLDALDRAAHTAGLDYAVVVTDGQENCGAWRAIETPANPIQTVVVLLPSVDDEKANVSPAVSFARRKAALLHAAPWISAVVAPWGFTADVFHAGGSSSPVDLARK
jgi:hypothetical protein